VTGSMVEKAPPTPADLARLPFDWMGRAVASQAHLVEDWARLMGNLAHTNAVFKTRVQKGGRISIPDAERDALGLDEGALVQVIVAPIRSERNNKPARDNQNGD